MGHPLWTFPEFNVYPCYIHIIKVSYKPILRVCKAASVAGALTFREQEKKVREGKQIVETLMVAYY